MNYGEKISRLRKTRGMTQEELGKVLNVTYQAVSKWERGESLPDFATMSQIAKYFQVPLDYFEDDNEIQQGSAYGDAVNEANPMLGVCTVCGKILKENEVYATSPKMICKDCAEKQEREAQQIAEQKQRELDQKEAARKAAAERAAEIEHGSGFDVKLIVSLILALAGYITFTVLCFVNESDRELLAALLFLVPLALFACTIAVFDFISDFKDTYDKPDGYNVIFR